MLLKERTWINEDGDACIEMMNAMEKMTAMNEEGQKQIREHKDRMEKVRKDMESGKLPAGVGPVAGLTPSVRDKPAEWEGPMPESFPAE
jgi:ABC-type Fe3+-citrate transport system substrate-binding protein